jgi:predicted TIM-barrel fold metal-dependent hydrolase
MTKTAHAASTAPTYTGPIFDGDTHVLECADAFSRYLPRQFRKDWGYHWKTGDDGEYALYVGHRKIEVSAGYYTEDGRVPPPGQLHEWLRAMKEGKENVDMRVPPTPDQVSRDLRMDKLDEFGVDGCIMFCGNMVATLSYLDEVEPAKAVLHAYNRWLAEDWGFAHRNRIFGVPILSLADPEAAVKEAEWVAKLGARAIIMPMGPVNGKSPAHPEFDPFWSVLNEAGIGVTYHVSEAIYMKDHMAVWGEKVQQSRQRQTAFIWMHGYGERPVIETLSSFVFHNFFARFPRIKMMSAENGCEWVPGMLVKMDKCRGMAMNGYWPMGQLKERPSEIFLKNIYVVAYPEDDIETVIGQTGSADFLVMGSDYPHAEGVPTPRDFVTEACRGLTPEQTRKVMHTNGWNFVNGVTNRGTR